MPKGCPRGKRKGLRASFALSGDLKGTPGSGDSKGSRGKAQGAKVLEIPLGSSKRAKECEEARVALASRAQEELLFPPFWVLLSAQFAGCRALILQLFVLFHSPHSRTFHYTAGLL